MDENNLFNNLKHGFRACRSCLSQLCLDIDKILKSLESTQNVNVIYLDFSEAFDKVDHKIRLLGISGPLPDVSNHFCLTL